MSFKLRVVDEGPGSHSFAEISKQQLGFLGTSVIFVSRPGLSERLIYKHLIPKSFEQDAAIIFALSASGNEHENLISLQQAEQIKIVSKRIYQIEKGNQNDSADAIEYLRNTLRRRSKNEKNFPVIFIFDTLQKWTEKLEVQIRYLIQEASFLNLSIWIHSPIFLIPKDLLPTIGNVVIIWPSISEVNLLAENLPLLDVELGAQKQSQGLFVYNKTSGKGWQFTEFTPQIASKL